MHYDVIYSSLSNSEKLSVLFSAASVFAECLPLEECSDAF
jgi:hypothetical protein